MAVGLLFMTGLLVTGIYLLIVHPVSAAQAEDMVGQAGYTDLYPFDANAFRDSVWFEYALDNGISSDARCRSSAIRSAITVTAPCRTATHTASLYRPRAAKSKWNSRSRLTACEVNKIRRHYERSITAQVR